MNKTFRLFLRNSSLGRVINCWYHSSPYSVDIPNCGLFEYLFRKTAAYPNRIALIDGLTGKSWSFEQLEAESTNLAKHLYTLGLRPHHVACLYGTNRPEFAHIVSGVALNNAALTISNSQLTPGELSHQLQETGASILFVTPDVAERAKEAAKLTPSVKEIIVIGEYDGCRPLSSMTTNCQLNSLSLLQVSSVEDTVLIPYSSGTTGLPKGVELTHRNLTAELAALSYKQFLPFSAEEKSLSMLPMVHIAGLVIGMLNPLSQGATVVTLPRFEPDTFLQSIQKYKCTFSLIAPPIVNFLANHPLVDQYDVTSLSTPYSGAAALGKELTEKMVERLGLSGIRQGYGMSEASPATHTTPLTGWKYGSVGIPLPNTECQVADLKTGNNLGVDETGEVWVRGPQVMKGYLNNEKATKETITDEGWLKTVVSIHFNQRGENSVDPDQMASSGANESGSIVFSKQDISGFSVKRGVKPFCRLKLNNLQTHRSLGDIGYYDSDGHYFIVDRLKEIIKYKGYQVAPAYLEAILLSHNSVQDAAVIGVPDKIAGEVPKAYVVLKEAVDEILLLSFVNDQVAPYKRLRGGIKVVEKLPRSPSGKILRRQIKQDNIGLKQVQ